MPVAESSTTDDAPAIGRLTETKGRLPPDAPISAICSELIRDEQRMIPSTNRPMSRSSSSSTSGRSFVSASRRAKLLAWAA